MQTLLKRGFSPTVQSVNRLLSSLLRAGRYRLLLHVFSQVTSNSVWTDSFADNLVVRAFLKTGRFEESEGRIAGGKESRLSRKKGLWDALIQGVCVVGKDPEKGFGLLLKCVRSNAACPSQHTFRSLVFSFSSAGRMDRAIEVVETMISAEVGYPIDNYVCSSIISGFCKVGKPELGLGFFENVRKNREFVPNLMTYTAVLDALLRGGQIEEASDLVQLMEDKGVAPDAFLYGCWASGYVNNGAVGEALAKHKLMVDRGIKPDVVNYSILADGFCKEGNVEKVIGLLGMMSANGAEPNLITYTSILQGFCKRGKLKEATSLLRKLEELGLPVDEFAYSTLINGWCREGDLEMVFKLLDEMEKKGVEMGTVTHNTVINGLCKLGNMTRANQLSTCFHGDIIGFSTLLCGYLREMNKPGVLEIVNRMEEAKTPMDVVGCNIIISAYFFLGMFEDALLLFRRMPEMGLAANSATFMSVINGCCKLGMVDGALEVIDEYVSTVLEPNLAGFRCIIVALCKGGMPGAATEVFIRLTSRGLVLGPGAHRMLIKTRYKEDRGVGVMKLLGSLDGLLQPDLLSSVCNDAMAFLCNKRCCEIAKELFILARRNNWVITVKSYYLLIKSLWRNGQLDLVSLVVNSCIKEYGFSEPRVINVLILFLCKKNVEKALWLLNQMAKRDVSYCVSTAIVESLKRVGRIEEAYKLVVEAKENGMAVDVVAYSIVVDGLCKEGHLEKALMLCTRMRDLGLEPNIFTYNSVINGLCRQGCLIEALRMFDAMGPNDVTPTVVTYATLIHALATEGHLTDARKLFEKMISSGIPSNLRVYSILINGYCRFGAVEEAMELLQQLEETSMQPDPFTVSSLVNGFCVLGDMEGALGFYADYKRRGIALDFLGFLLLIEGLRAKGRLEEARSILWDMLQCQSIIDIVNKPNIEIEGGSLLGSLAFLCEQGRIDEAIVVLCEVGSFTSPIGRFIGDCRRAALKRSYKGDEDLSMGNRVENLDREDLSSPVQEFSEEDDRRTNLGLRTPKLCHSDLVSRKGDGQGLGTEDVEDLIGRSEFHDFDLYYPVIASLCSKGELQKASYALKHVMANSGKHS
ncbi:unnamed protein product [Spirodela intermedia]|uniref:Uncharacterized protein n=1 Tax=Spirodela intermedia TaxID=51605 RepID=A0A7I8KN97_SPIIN|nr:unnamed protein product [Spirodela intermedia]